ncbi:hypothetical protein EU537_03445 [Candidatus Thorarchaeota archaeon]|nr:MAG: hypothetical protein EU537_03445 [Candidatus Thorarchaeota archaeon]
MKVKLKVESRWLDFERESMDRLRREYESWQQETLEKAKQAVDLRSLREVFYELGDRWEWNQTTGDWLTSGEPLDTIGLVLRMPGLKKGKERYVVYAIMAYSKGFTSQFDHLGDKERIIIEQDLESGEMYCWSTTGHGAANLFPENVSQFDSIEDMLENSYLVAQPGDHALRLELPREVRYRFDLFQTLWEIAGGNEISTQKETEVVSNEEIEETLDFKFYRFAKSVIDLERTWESLKAGAFDIAREAVLDELPDHIERRNKTALRKIEGLLHILWFKPPVYGLGPARFLYKEFEAEPTPTAVHKSLVPFLGDLVYSLNSIVEKAKYLKWKSVMDKDSFLQSDIFKGLNLSALEKEAFAAALDDLLRQHTLSYMAYPEKATAKDKVLRTIFGILVLPVRLIKSFNQCVRLTVRKIRNWILSGKEESKDSPSSEKGSHKRSNMPDK